MAGYYAKSQKTLAENFLLEADQLPDSAEDPLYEMLFLAILPLASPKNSLGGKGARSLEVIVKEGTALENIPGNRRFRPAAAVAKIA